MSRFMSKAKRAIVNAPRGFVLVVVLMALAIVTAVVVGQLAVTRSEAGASLRAEEEVQARAIAEGCLALMQTYVDKYMNPSAPRFDDFDQLLDPNFSVTAPTAATGSRGESGDEFLPLITGATAVVRLDGGAVSSATALQNWRLLRRGPSANPGACLLRIEDNSDDGLADVGTALGATGPREGPMAIPTGNSAIDNPYRDRDRAIYLTAIGVYPAFSATADANVWKSAHARVTLRRLYSVAQRPQARPAVKACGNVDFDNGTTICGSGGIESSGTVDIGGGASCSCGATSGTTVTGNTLPCACCTNPPSSSPGSPAVCDPPPNPLPTSHLGISAFGNPNNLASVNLGDPTVCKAFTTDIGNTFLWDVTDPTPLTTLQTTYGLTPTGVGAVNMDCRNYNGVANFTGIGTMKEVQRPCGWVYPTGGGGTCASGDEEGEACVTAADCDGGALCTAPGGVFPGKPVVTCTATESLCWKPITIADRVDERLDFLASGQGDFEWESNNKDGDLLFYKGIPIPYSADRTKVLGAATDATRFCGSNTTACPTCTANMPIAENRLSPEWFHECNAGGVGVTCSDFHAHDKWSNKRFPAPMVLVMEQFANKKIQAEQDLADTEPLWLTLSVTKDVNMKAGLGMCSAHMPNMCKPPTTGMTGRSISSANCRDGNSQIPASPYAPPTKREPPDFSYPVVYRAAPVSGNCDFDQSVTLVGTVECPLIHMKAQQCIVGALVGTSSSSTGAMTNCITPECPSASICIEDNFDSANATLWGIDSICGGNTNSAIINADIFTSGNIDFKNNISVRGSIQALGNVFFKNNATIDAGGNLIITTGSQSMTSFMECAW